MGLTILQTTILCDIDYTYCTDMNHEDSKMTWLITLTMELFYPVIYTCYNHVWLLTLSSQEMLEFWL